MARGKSLILVAAFAAFCLAFGYWWSVTVGLPLSGEKPWWYGKDAHVRIQVLEPGRDMATVSMRLPKGFMDTMVALGTNAKICFDDDGATNIGYSGGMQHEIRLRDIWKDLQKLPKGQKITIDENGTKLSIWIEA